MKHLFLNFIIRIFCLAVIVASIIAGIVLQINFSLSAIAIIIFEFFWCCSWILLALIGPELIEEIK